MLQEAAWTDERKGQRGRGGGHRVGPPTGLQRGPLNSSKIGLAVYRQCGPPFLRTHKRKKSGPWLRGCPSREAQLNPYRCVSRPRSRGK
eukprot:4542010-Alexandrium_andersonii.AAC.1